MFTFETVHPKNVHHLKEVSRHTISGYSHSFIWCKIVWSLISMVLEDFVWCHLNEILHHLQMA